MSGARYRGDMGRYSGGIGDPGDERRISGVDRAEQLAHGRGGHLLHDRVADEEEPADTPKHPGQRRRVAAPLVAHHGGPSRQKTAAARSPFARLAGVRAVRRRAAVGRDPAWQGAAVQRYRRASGPGCWAERGRLLLAQAEGDLVLRERGRGPLLQVRPLGRAQGLLKKLALQWYRTLEHQPFEGCCVHPERRDRICNVLVQGVCCTLQDAGTGLSGRANR